MTQEEFDEAPKVEQVLYDCTGMLAVNHPAILEAMEAYAEQQALAFAQYYPMAYDGRMDIVEMYQDFKNKQKEEQS